MDSLAMASLTVLQGATWTTDAPFRETEAAIRQAREHGALAVEMEAAALYAFARARRKPVLCFAHVTNQMAQVEGDFEKGEANGAHDALELLAITTRAWRSTGDSAMRPNPLDDVLEFLARPIWPTPVFWLLLIGSAAIAFTAWRREPAQRTAS